VATSRLRFPITLDIAGERMAFIGCDMLVGWFFQGFPDPMPLTDCWKKEATDTQRELVNAMETWHDQLLCRGIWLVADPVDGNTVCRRLTPELVQRLGDQRDRAVAAYMSGIGWIRPEDKGYEISADALPRPLPPLVDPFADAERRAAMTRIPSANILLHVKQVAEAAGQPAHAIWRRWWMSEFIWTWRTHEAERKERGPAVHHRGLPADFAHIGVEA
jgi:hypothetical protein